jgi:hypothetical protein
MDPAALMRMVQRLGRSGDNGSGARERRLPFSSTSRRSQPSTNFETT